MYNTEIEKIDCIILGYTNIIHQYYQDLIIPLNKEFQVCRYGLKIVIKATPESLHNLFEAPAKAVEIIDSIGHYVKRNKYSNNSKIEMNLFDSLIQPVRQSYINDKEASLFIISISRNIRKILSDDSEFSEFLYF